MNYNLKPTESFESVPRDSLWHNKIGMGRASNDQLASVPSDSSGSTSTLVDEGCPGKFLTECYDNDRSRLRKRRKPDTTHELYMSPFANSSTTYGDMPEIPLVPRALTERSHNDAKEQAQSFWSSFIRPKRTKGESISSIVNVRSISAPRCAPSMSPSPSTSSTSSSETKVMPMKSSLSSSPSMKSKDCRKQISVKFVETPTFHSDLSHSPKTRTPRELKPKSSDGGLFRRLVGSLKKGQEQAVPRRPSISGPYPMYCAAGLIAPERGVRATRSHASLRTTASARSCSSFRIFWERLTRPDG